MNCSNPNCQEQNIPNEAIYCPICGKLLEKYLPASPLFTNAYRNLVEKRANLYAERQSFLLFQHERNTLYKTLNKFDNFQSETEEFIKLMKKTKFKKSIKEPENFIPWITCTCMLVLTLFFFFQGVSISLDQDEIGMFWFGNTFRALTLGVPIGIVIGLILCGLCYLYLEYVAEPDDIDIFHNDSHYYKKNMLFNILNLLLQIIIFTIAKSLIVLRKNMQSNRSYVHLIKSQYKLNNRLNILRIK